MAFFLSGCSSNHFSPLLFSYTSPLQPLLGEDEEELIPSSSFNNARRVPPPRSIALPGLSERTTQMVSMTLLVTISSMLLLQIGVNLFYIFMSNKRILHK